MKIDLSRRAKRYDIWMGPGGTPGEIHHLQPNGSVTFTLTS